MSFLNSIVTCEPLTKWRQHSGASAKPDRPRHPADRIINLIETGTINTQPWITHRTGFDELIGLIPSFTKPETGVIKAIVEVPTN